MEKYISINRNGRSVRCKLYCTDIKRVDAAVIFGHGFSGHKDNRAAAKLAERIMKRHGNVLLIVFNWPCHGDDASNKLRLADCTEYLQIVIDYVGSAFHTDRLYACATSFGGYLFLKYIAENGCPFLRVALRCPAVNMDEVLTEKIMTDDELHAIRKGKPVRIGFDRKVKVTKDFLAELSESGVISADYAAIADKTVIIHGTKDEIVSFDTVKAFAERNGIAFCPIEGADHRFSDPHKMDAAIDCILSHFSMK